ncbi:MAG TPA: potassium-transporting ATPase subunit KdpA [Longimicrobiales bacterium]|nr:potassium-transporting ATPase subunit KdpA [Longimicrobiales bacterium]
MTAKGVLQVAFFLVVLLALAAPLGRFIARVFEGGRVPFLGRALGPVERACYRLSGIDPSAEMTWRTYAGAFLASNLVGMLALYALLRLQGVLPQNGGGFGGVDPDTSFNIAVSFASNTNWQNYSGETTLSHLTQMLGLTVQNFLSAAAGMAVLAALIRGFARRETHTIGNYWTDLVRSVVYVLLPLSLVLALMNVSQGAVQTLDLSRTVELVDPFVTDGGAVVTQQTLAVGPVASQVAIKQLGTNGGGFYNVNSAHPFENPNAISNILQMLAILVIPGALCTTFGRMVGDVRQGRALLAAMLVVFVPLTFVTYGAEQAGTPALVAAGAEVRADIHQPGGNMEGKEARFGIANSALWATATTAASNGSVNSMHDSYTPLGGLVPMWLMQLGEVIFGGVGSGLYGMLIFAIVAVFVAGLMVGRTPEYLGKKIEPFEMKMASLAILVPPAVVLVATALTVVLPGGVAGMQDGGPHGLSEVLYAYSSMGNNNGSAYAGYGADTPLVNTLGGLCMLFARYWVAIPALAIAGALAAKKRLEPGPGTLPTHTPLFVALLTGVVLLVGALTFVPALALGPVAEAFLMMGR